MKNLLKISLFAFAILSFTSCDDDDVNLAPSVPSFFTPADDAVDVAKEMTLKWGASIDPEKSMVKYSVYLGTKEDLTDEDIKGKDLTKNECAVTLAGHTIYYWKVKAIDEQDNMIESEVYSFKTLNSLPSLAVIADVEETMVDNKINLKISWAASIDADSDEIKYDVYLSADDIFEATDLIAVSTKELEITKENVLDNTNYNIKVVSKDGIGTIESAVKFHKTQMIDGKAYEGSFIDSRDNHEYKTAIINGTTWMAENLAYLPYFTNDTEDAKKCSVYGLPIVKPMVGGDAWVMPTLDEAKAHENFAKYGVMYSAAILEDIAPEGWHVATDEEWMALERLSGMEENDLDWTGYRGATMHKFLGATSTWAEGKMTLDPAPSDDFKLNIKPGGYNKVLEDAGLEIYTYYWTNTYIENMFGKKYWNRAFNGTKTGVNRGNTKRAEYRMYVRLVKDSE